MFTAHAHAADYVGAGADSCHGGSNRCVAPPLSNSFLIIFFSFNSINGWHLPHPAVAPPQLSKTRNLRLGIPSKGRMAELTLELLNVRMSSRSCSFWALHDCCKMYYSFMQARCKNSCPPASSTGLPAQRSQSKRQTICCQDAERADLISCDSSHLLVASLPPCCR